MPTARRLKRGGIIFMSGGVLAILATGLIPVAAQVIGDPLGLVSVGTSGESTSGSVLAVSNGGNANGGADGAGVSTTGTGSGGLAGASAGSANGGLVAVSGTGCASNGNVFANVPVAISATGCSSSFGTAISGTGTASGGLVGVSGTGNSSGLVAISGTGTPSGTYSADSNGEVAAEGQQLSVYTGAELGGPQSPDQVLDPTYVATWTTPPQEIAAKEQAAANIAAAVAYNMATGAAGGASTRSNTQCPPGGCVPVAETLPWSGWAQQTTSTCGPSSTQHVLSNLYGEGASEYHIADLEHGHNGTSFGNIPPVMNNLFVNDGGGYRFFSADNVRGAPNTLMNYLTQDIVYGPQNGKGNAVIYDVQPTDFPWWQGLSSPDGHYVVGNGYDHRSGGQVSIWDEYDISKFYSHYPRNPYGQHTTTLANLEAAMNHGGPFGEMIW